MARALLGGSVAGNALGHGLAAYGARPHWLVVVAVSAVAPVVLAAVVHLAVLATHPDHPADREPDQVDHGADQTGPTPDQADRPRTAVSPTDLDLAAELAELAGRSGKADQPGPAPERPPAVVPNHLDDDPTLLADLGGWAADQVGRPSRNAVMRRYGIGATRTNQLLDGLSRSGAAPAPDQGDRGPDHSGPATHDDNGEVTS